LAGFRCRAQLCIPLADEVCNGEDDNDNGFIDEHGDRVSSRAVLSGGEALKDSVLAWGGGALLGSTSFELDGGGAFTYQPFDDARRRGGGSRSAGPLASATENVTAKALTATDAGFSLGFAVGAPSAEVRFLPIAHDGTAGAVARLGSTSTNVAILRAAT